MFGLGARKIELPPPVFLRPEPQMIPPRSVAYLKTYEDLASKLEFAPAQLLQEQLLQFFTENSIPRYDNDRVFEYLVAAVRKARGEDERMCWIWRPLRKRDEPDGWEMSGRTLEFKQKDGWKEEERRGAYRHDFDHRPYDKAVPIRILRQVEGIQNKFGNRLNFFVSDYGVPSPDPFIMVTALDVEQIIFGVWDEPDFGLNG